MIRFKSRWTFVRDNPVGKEKVEGEQIVILSKKDFLPVIEMLERNNHVTLPQIGITNSATTIKSTGPVKYNNFTSKTSLSQVNPL